MRQPLGAVPAFAMIEASYNALAGEYGLAWQVVCLILTVAVELMGLLAAFALLSQKSERGLTDPPQGVNPTASSEEVFAHDTKNGEVDNQQEAAEGAEPDERKPRARWFPHPDDPSPAEAGRTPQEEDESFPAPSSHSRPESEADIYHHIRRLAELINAEQERRTAHAASPVWSPRSCCPRSLRRGRSCRVNPSGDPITSRSMTYYMR